jgi:hypothetical protein
MAKPNRIALYVLGIIPGCVQDLPDGLRFETVS